MGAVTALLYSEKDPYIISLVLDSPFSNLKELATEIGKENAIIPAFLVGGGFDLINKTIKEKIGADLSLLNPKNAASAITAPAFFIVARDDKLVKPHHTE